MIYTGRFFAIIFGNSKNNCKIAYAFFFICNQIYFWRSFIYQLTTLIILRCGKHGPKPTTDRRENERTNSSKKRSSFTIICTLDLDRLGAPRIPEDYA